MKKTTLLILALSLLSFLNATNPVTIIGASGIDDNTSYSTLKEAFDAINAQPDQTGKDIEIQISANTTETASAVLNQPATASWNSLTIYPTTENVTIEGGFGGTIIDLNGSDNVTINGRLNKSGAPKSLTISHTSNADNGNRTIRLYNDAKNNIIQHATITGKCPSTGAGVIFFSTTTGTDGNDENIIEYCDINAMGAAAVGIGSAGTADKANSGNIIRNNNIFDFYLGSTSTNATYGINIAANNTDWIISGNSLYQTASRSYNGTTGAFHYGIYISATTGNNFVITDNYIGGSTANASGTPWTLTGGLGRPVPLYTSVGTTTPSSIQNNTITNFDITTDFVTNGSSAFIGYWHAAGSVNVGTVTGNTIGSSTSTGAIVVKYNSAAAGALTVGINIVTASAATMVFSNNKIGGIIADYLNTANRGHLYAVSTSGAGALTFTNNIIGSETVINSIEHKGSTYSGGQVNLRGITMGNVGATTVTDNLIANLTASSTASMAINGIFHNGGGVNNIINNTIRDINSAGTRVITTQGTDAGLIGIVLNSNSAGNIVGRNTIYNLENTNTTLATDVYGINFHSLNAGASSIVGNKIYDLKTASTNTASNVVGISITRGLTNTINNMISLGDGISNAVSIVGIRKLGTAATQKNNFYHNTVLIGGSEVGVAGSSYTAAFAKVYSATDEVKNNVFVNARSNASGNTQKHYIVNINDITTFTSNNNVVSITGEGGLLGAVGATDYPTGDSWVTATSQDTNSKTATILFSNPAAGDLTLTGLSVKDFDLRVPYMAAVTKDILNTERNTKFTYAGAHEAALPFIYKTMQGIYEVGNGTTDDFATLGEAINAVNDAIAIDGNIVLEITSDITEPANFGLGKNLNGNSLTIRPDADADRTITFTQATANTDIDGHFVIGYKTQGLALAKDNQYLIATNNVTIDGYPTTSTTNRRLKFTTSDASLASSVLINIVGGSTGTILKNAVFSTLSTATNPTNIAITQYLSSPVDLSPANILIENNQITAVPATSSVNGIGIICGRSGTATTLISNLNIKNNTIVASGKAIEINYSNGANIQGNEFKIQKGTGTGIAYGIWLRGKSGDMNIIGNRFTEVSTLQASGTVGTQAILVSANASNPFNTNIFNNTFAGMDRKATGATNVNQTYIAEIGYGTTKIYNNSFYLPVLTQPTQNGAYNAISFSTTSYKADIQNNIFISNEDSKSVLISKAVTTGTMNNNIYYLRAGNTNAKIVDTYNTLAAFQAANTTLDVNSKSVDVNFENSAQGDLRIAGASVQDANLRVPSLAAVTTDILGTIRNTEFTYAGAHESTLPFIATGLEGIDDKSIIRRTLTGIEIMLNNESTIQIYNANGVLIEKTRANGIYSRSLSNGVYIISINGKAVKFVK